MRTLVALLMPLISAAAVAQTPSWVWWEAEKPAKAELPGGGWIAPVNEQEKDVLSGGDWLTWDQRTPGRPATIYEIQVPKTGTYELWVRRHGNAKFDWAFDGQPLQAEHTPGTRQNTAILDISQTRYLTLAWERVCTVDLKEGKHLMGIRMLAAEKPAGAIDCFVLHEGPFVARGKFKPDEPVTDVPAGWFAFEPGTDPLKESPLDMRQFNKAPAGTDGRIIRQGDRLVFEKTGRAVRCWGVTATDAVWRMSEAQMDYLAQRVAKMGINMVRFHVAPYDETTPDGPQTKGLHYLVAALKKQGVYSGFNWYCLATAKVKPSWNLEGLENGSQPFSLHLFYPPMQGLYKVWAKNLLGSVNPHTGLSFAQDPAVAFVELVDEDNFFFWTFDPKRTSPKALPVLEKDFGQWCALKYGSVEKTLEAWGDGPRPAMTDTVGEGRLALYSAGQLGGASWAASQRNPKRASDQLQFLTQTQRDFCVGMKTWLKDELGYTGMVIGTNWNQSDPRVLGPLDNYANMGVDITARNTYFSPPFTQGKFFPWTTGDAYCDGSVLLEPEQAMLTHMQYAGYPHFITEGGYTQPNRFRTEEQLLMATYASLQGIDGLFPFQLEGDWNDTVKRWPIQTPATLAQYPAASLIYRMGYVQEAAAVNEALKLADLYQFKGSAVRQVAAFDLARAKDYGKDGMSQAVNAIDPLAFYTGRVFQTIAEEPGVSTVHADLGKLIGREKKMVCSITGEATLDYGRGLLVLDASKAVGVTGFTGAAGAVQAGVATISLGNEYGAVMLVSMDDQPLEKSAKMLLQVCTEETNRNWTTEPVKTKFGGKEQDAKRITRIGTSPMLLREVQGQVTLNRPDAAELKVTALDLNGYPAATTVGAKTITLQPRTLYYVIGR